MFAGDRSLFDGRVTRRDARQRAHVQRVGCPVGGCEEEDRDGRGLAERVALLGAFVGIPGHRPSIISLPRLVLVRDILFIFTET